MDSNLKQDLQLERREDHWLAAFHVMASPCEILIDIERKSEAEELASLALFGARRIETKFSRYRTDNIVHAINHSGGKPVEIDEETHGLLAIAGQCFELSEGRFDITSGVLRRAWTFNGQPVTPDVELIASLLQLVGWDKVELTAQTFCLQPGMEIDFGGIGKEYAVDKVANMLSSAADCSVLVNFGGDICALNLPEREQPWRIGIEDPEKENNTVGEVTLQTGAVATSGDARRFCLVDGVRMGHILDPRTGWPVVDAPRSVTVIATHCTEAGIMATMAMLLGGEAEEFLEGEGIQYHSVR